MTHTTRRAFIAALLLLADTAAHAQPQRRLEFPPLQPVVSRNGMVVTQEARASLIGAEVLKRGGNAVDAAVALGFAMAVTYPRAGNIARPGAGHWRAGHSRRPHARAREIRLRQIQAVTAHRAGDRPGAQGL